MLDDVLALLRCPHCGADLIRSGPSVRCAAGHGFDVARQGYLGLLPGDAQQASADTPAMVAARARFLAGGHFEPLAQGLADACAAADPPPGDVVDVGAGTGWYLARVLDRLPGRAGLALDLSKPALRRAARAHERIGAVAADAWRPLPVRDGAAALVLSVFAPREGAEIARVLRPVGALVVVAPTARHLAELVGALDLPTVDERKRERLAEKLDPHLGAAGETRLEWGLELEHEDVRAVVAMGPSAWHVERSGLDRALAALPEPMEVTASVEISVHRRA